MPVLHIYAQVLDDDMLNEDADSGLTPDAYADIVKALLPTVAVHEMTMEDD